MGTFGTVVRSLRVRLLGKQLTLAMAIGCTEAAVSFWETGTRVPSARLLASLVTCLERAGASNAEIRELVTAYRSAIIDRRQRSLDSALASKRVG